MRLSDRLLDVVVYTLLAILIAVTLYPLLYVLFASLSDGDRLLAHRGLLWKPLGFVTFAYERALSNPAVWTGYWNTIRLVAGGVILNLTMTILGAYVLSRRNVLWNKVLMIFVVVTMFFSGGMIPFYLVIKQLGLMTGVGEAQKIGETIKMRRSSSPPCLCCSCIRSFNVFSSKVLWSVLSRGDDEPVYGVGC
ncbi:hypothetical protein [Paenibacillus sp. URB8-2]|uniref:hypothetical protein n=1 Tax=Paenibacillus sp. URB8-2 TaxID=2741301 RepID=UPI0015C272FA|nr:hypothetical protein PUR_26910 [Paenibacillus sp. URB8-2]